jgi:hypothetical protein
MIDAEAILACSDADLERLRWWLDRLRYALAIGVVPAEAFAPPYFRYQVGAGDRRQPRRAA